MISMRIEQGQPVAGKLVYRAAEYAFATEPRPATCGSSFTINEIELMLADDERQRVVFVEGYCPHAGWRISVLRPPVAFPGILRGVAAGPIKPGIAMAVQAKDDRWPVLVDPTTGWVRLGTGDPNEDHEGAEFAPGTIAVLDSGLFRALWLRPESLPTL